MWSKPWHVDSSCHKVIAMKTASLIVVPCHATLQSGGSPEWLDKNWFLQVFQAGEVPFYEEHARHGVVQAMHSPDALLLFSGGRTREGCQLAEGQSYWQAAMSKDWWLPTQEMCDSLSGRASYEDFARDSFENILFSMLSFFKVNNAWPECITAVGWEFKRLRFDLHRRALRIPDIRWRYEGVNQPFDLAGALKGETKAIAAFASDPYGCHSELRVKRNGRNPQNDPNPYLDLPEVADFLEFLESGAEGNFPGKFPWE
jgi:hypothetical protein